MKYTFDKSEHIHTLDGKPLIGVTTALQVISKPFLIQWSANMACDYVRDNLKKIEDLEEVLGKAKTAHRIKKEKSGDWGTEVHLAIEEWIKDKKEPKLKDNQKIVFDKFKDWANKNKVEFLESEKHLYSESLWIGGICDLVLKIDGKKYIGDIKTSSGIYDEAFFQMGAYNLCLEEMGEHKDVEGYIVINLRKDGVMDMKIATDIELNKQAFKSALALHKIINSLK
jgi:CRISPR/Cas system-associated exonuclease Cas4 (RecB family)